MFRKESQSEGECGNEMKKKKKEPMEVLWVVMNLNKGWLEKRMNPGS